QHLHGGLNRVELRLVSETNEGDLLPQMFDDGNVVVAKIPIVSAGGVREATLLDSGHGRYLSLLLATDATQALAKTSAENIGQKLAIVVDRKVVASPVIRVPLRGNTVAVTTRSDAELEKLEAVVNTP